MASRQRWELFTRHLERTIDRLRRGESAERIEQELLADGANPVDVRLLIAAAVPYAHEDQPTWTPPQESAQYDGLCEWGQSLIQRGRSADEARALLVAEGCDAVEAEQVVRHILEMREAPTALPASDAPDPEPAQASRPFVWAVLWMLAGGMLSAVGWYRSGGNGVNLELSLGMLYLCSAPLVAFYTWIRLQH